MPAIYHEGSWLGNATDPEVLVKDTVGWTGKNLIETPYVDTRSTVNGVSCTINYDGSVTLRGTSTGAGSYFLSQKSKMTDHYKKLSGKKVIISGGLNNNITVQFWSNSTGVKASTGQDVIFELPNLETESDWNLVIHFNNVFNNNTYTIYPMLRDASITDPTYEPYHESVEEEIEQIYADNGVLGAKNLLPNELEAKTVGGVTVTINDDNSVTLNGTATESLDYQLQISAKIKDILEVGKRYILTGCPANGSTSSYCLVWRLNNASSPSMPDIDDGDGSEFTWQQYTGTVALRIRIQSGYTCNNLVFKPMLRLASDPDDTYQPYAMTNRELTEKANTYGMLLPSTTDLNNIIENGIYFANNVTTNAPTGISSSYYGLIVMSLGENTIRQLLITKDAIYTRSKGGSPVVWSSWYKYTGTVVS